jgi:hypothetical protein
VAALQARAAEDKAAHEDQVACAPPPVLIGHAASLIPHPVLIGHAASLSQVAGLDDCMRQAVEEHEQALRAAERARAAEAAAAAERLAAAQQAHAEATDTVAALEASLKQATELHTKMMEVMQAQAAKAAEAHEAAAAAAAAALAESEAARAAEQATGAAALAMAQEEKETLRENLQVHAAPATRPPRTRCATRHRDG